GRDVRDREGLVRAMQARVDAVPAAKAAIDIAAHDAVAKLAGLPLWALLGSQSKPHLTISRVVSIKTPEAMAADAVQHVQDGFATVKLKVGDWRNPHLDVARVAAVREAVGPAIGIKIDVNQGWQSPGIAIPAIRAILASNPDYIEQPVDQHDIPALAEVRRATGAPIMADECVHGVHEMQRVVELRAADLVNIKLMKTGGIFNAMRVNAIAEAAGIVGQVGTMVESSIASAAGLHFAMAQANIRTCEMGGPLMISGDIGNLRSCYAGNQITLPDAAGLGVDLDVERIEATAERRIVITGRQV
ncbi:MAG TPA: enolase C-terminal domain-like protein, partial [Thermomicrobiales bacterium]|nr:enolase C-terminal domain-like protein [Thermomicrobiales bacterium]